MNRVLLRLVLSSMRCCGFLAISRCMTACLADGVIKLRLNSATAPTQPKTDAEKFFTRQDIIFSLHLSAIWSLIGGLGVSCTRACLPVSLIDQSSAVWCTNILVQPCRCKLGLRSRQTSVSSLYGTGHRGLPGFPACARVSCCSRRPAYRHTLRHRAGRACTSQHSLYSPYTLPIHLNCILDSL